MKQRLLSLLILLLSWGGLSADEGSGEMLSALQQRLEGMPGYRVDFEVQVGGQTFAGRYLVQGDDYYMTLAGSEVFGLDGVRYEVDPSKREVIIDQTDYTSHNLLNNPTRAFSILKQEFDHRLLAREQGVVTLELQPRTPEVGISRITLLLEAQTATPRSLRYDAEGEQVVVTIRQLTAEGASIHPFEAKNYPDYEIIDFR